VRWEEGVRIDGNVTIIKGRRVREVATEGNAGGRVDRRTMMTDYGDGSDASSLSDVVQVQR
jgi:hypothetical protein